MNVISTKKLANGKQRILIELDEKERIFPVKLTDNRHYQLGHPHGDVVPDSVIYEAVQVSWCCVSQKWVG